MNPLTPEQIKYVADRYFAIEVKDVGRRRDEFEASLLSDRIATPPKTILYSLHPDREELRQQMEGVPGFEYAFMLTRGQIGFEERDGVWRLTDRGAATDNIEEVIERHIAGRPPSLPAPVISLDLELGRILTPEQVGDVLFVLERISRGWGLPVSLYGHPNNGDADVYAESRLAAEPIYESGLFNYLGPSCYAGRLTNLAKDGQRFLEVLDRTADCCAEYDVEAMPNFNQRYVHAHPEVGTQLVPEREFMTRSSLMIERFGRVMLWSEGHSWLNRIKADPGIIADRPDKFDRYMQSIAREGHEHQIPIADGWRHQVVQANSKRSYDRVLKLGDSTSVRG